MAGKVFGKIMDIFCLDEDSEEMEEMETSEFETKEEDYELSKVDKGKVVNIHTNSSAKVVIVKPYDFEEAAAICDNLKSRKIVIINISALDQKVGQRLLDFIGGASYIVGGDIQEVEKGIYILSPSNVEVSNSLKFELQSKGVFSFAK